MDVERLFSDTAGVQSRGRVSGDAATPGLAAARAVGIAADLAPALFAEAARVDMAGAFPVESIALLREHGLLAAPLPATHGGASLCDPAFRLQQLHVLAHIGRGSLPVGRLYEGHVNALMLVSAFGDAAQRARHFDAARAGHLFSVWNTEAGDGLRAVGGAPDGWLRLQGCKTFASGAGVVARALVTLRDADGGWQMAVVPVDDPQPAIDRSFWQPMGMRASASHKVDFGGLSVGRDDLLGAPGDYYREPAFGTGAVRVAAVQQGGVEAVFDETRRYLRQLGRIDDPHQRARLGEMAALVASGRQWLLGAAQQALASVDGDHGLGRVRVQGSAGAGAAVGAGAAAGAGDEEATAEHARAVVHAHLMRTAIEAIALRVLPLAERCVGARGLIAPEPFERLHRDLTHYLRQAGPDAVVTAAGAHVLARTEPAHRLWVE